MPHPPRIKMRGMPVPFLQEGESPNNFLNDLPPQILEEVKAKKEDYVQFRMPIDIWAKLRARQFNMEIDAHNILKQSNLPVNNIEIPMTEILRETMKDPLHLKDDKDLLKLAHKRGFGRIFK